MKFVFLCLGCLSCLIARSQQTTTEQMVSEAMSAYQNGNYEIASTKYLEVLDNFEVSDESESTINHRYNAACMLSLANKLDLAFSQLQILSDIGYSNRDQLLADNDLVNLHSDERWSSIIEAITINYEKLKPLSKEELKLVFDAFQEAKRNVFRTGSTVADVDRMFSFYTDDYEYNHPKYGGIYTREHLYNNTIKFLKRGAYNNYPSEEVTNIILGENAVAIEFKTSTSDETRMTLFKFRKDKIFYVEEYW